MSIVLASGSPRRRELLEMMLGQGGFEIAAASAEEEPSGTAPDETVMSVAEGKARAVAAGRPPEDVVIAADTLVFLDGRRLGKPESEEHAVSMLTSLSGRTHQVYTGVCVMNPGGRTICRAERTDVTFRSFTKEEAETYVKTGEPMDKAGAYGIQGRGSVLVERINGDYFNVVGLPMCLLYGMLKQFGIELLGYTNRDRHGKIDH